MIHEIEPKKYDPTYKNIKAKDEDYSLAYRGNQVFACMDTKTGRIFLPKFEDIRNLDGVNDRYGGILDNAYYLFSISDEKYFLAEFETEGFPVLPDSEALSALVGTDKAVTDPSLSKDGRIFFFMNVNKLRDVLFTNGANGISLSLEVYVLFAAATGGHMAWWKNSRQFCGFCGCRTKPSEIERAMVCPECGNTEYPKISPAVIVAVIKKGDVKAGDRLLLVRNNYGSYRRLALVAGFVEIGESFEQAVHREVMEEVGLKVKNLRYYKNQPWGLSYAQMIGFTAELDGEDEIRLQESELSEGGWYSRDEVPDNPFSLSVGNEMIHCFRTGEL